MRDFDHNVCCLFDCESYYEVSGNKETWSALTRAPGSSYPIKSDVDFTACLNRAIEHRAQAESIAPIVAWVDEQATNPYFALLGSGEIRFFKSGHYLAPLKDDILTNILRGYVLEAEHDQNNYSCEYESPNNMPRIQHNENLLNIFGVDGYYELSTCNNLAYIYKNIFNEKQASAHVKGLKNAIKIAIQENKQAGTEYPIFIRNDKKPGCENPIVITGTMELKCYKYGFYSVPYNVPLERASRSILAYKTEQLLNARF